MAAAEATLIGVCDGQLHPARHRSSFATNKVGGEPDWLPPVPGRRPRCRLCGAPAAHVVQVYCPLDSSPNHRNLHVFACTAAECSGRSDSWTVLRSQCSEAEVAAGRRPARAPEPVLRPTDWCDAADDWGVEAGDDWGGGGGSEEELQTQAESPEVSRQLQDLHLEELPQDAAAAFCPFFISVLEEADLYGEDEELEHAQQLLREYERREGAVAAEELEESRASGEKYEKPSARHGDRAFCRFMKQISACPQQILRYRRGGAPLFISTPPSNMAQLVTACSSCGGSRTFELQLMPALVSLLQRTAGSAEAELEFGTVLVYTCANSCRTPGSLCAVEEFCFVQTDPDQQLFRTTGASA